MLQNLFNTKDELLQTVKEHPYFTPAQFLLLKQTESWDNSYSNQIAKTGILFNNPFWLNFQLLHRDKKSETEQAVAIPETIEIDTINSIETTKVAQTQLPVEEEETAIDEVSNIEIAPIKIDLKLSEATTTEDSLHFEPLHTTDYFASQGIKLSEEIKSDDKLGKQLKSFTEWLKTMKKIHVEEKPESSSVSDISIQQLAEKSNEEGIILTEAMAEVLIQQGKAGKALEVYQKLSLLNPSKSAYFAAKIEQFKV